MGLIVGTLAPTRGRVVVGEADLAEVRRSWQRSLGYVSQHSFILDDTVRRNVALGLDGQAIDDERVAEVLRIAQLSDWVAGLSDGVDTMVGDRGARLSGGERQRLAIARALYPRPSVLVLDEATSSLDPATEARLLQALQAHGPTTRIVVAHTPAGLLGSDRLWLVQGGTVEDRGTPSRAYAPAPTP